MISVSHLIRKKIKTEDIILENDSESLVMGFKLTNRSNFVFGPQSTGKARPLSQRWFKDPFLVDHIQEKVSLETRSELLDVSGE